MSKTKPTKDVVLAPIGVFKNAVKTILSNSKKKSDEQLGDYPTCPSLATTLV